MGTLGSADAQNFGIAGAYALTQDFQVESSSIS